jgi:penicillin-binding protein 2
LQIVQGPSIEIENELRDTKNREIKATRGNIYDRNGKLLASNVLTYAVMMEDNTKIESNEQRNKIIHQLIQIVEKNGDTLDNAFYIRLNEKGEFEFTVEGAALKRFKKNAYAYVLDENNELNEEQKDASAQEVYEFLRNGTGNAYTRMFEISDEYSVEESLKIMGVRYALFCNYPKYFQITVASNVSDSTVAAVMENGAELLGVEVQQQTHRVYNDSIYLAHMMGYTGLISEAELEEYDSESEYYNSTDIIGKSGLEKEYESYLGGTKGSEILSVGISGKVEEVLDRIEPIAGNDIYLTIDSDLQRATYQLLEKEIARILLTKIKPDLNYGSKGESAADINIPIYEVYFALLNNNIIDITAFQDSDATQLEKQTYEKYKFTLNNVFQKLDTLLSPNNTITNDKAGDMEDFLDYFYSVLLSNDILLANNIPQDNATLVSYKNDKVTLSSFIQYAIANNWVDLSKLNIGDEYYSAEELYEKLISYTKDILEKDDKFNKKIYRNLVFSYNLSGTEICLLLFDQGVLEYKEEEINRLKNSGISAYDFMISKLTSLEITPAMLALEPCSGSLVITDVTTGDVLALVTYPSYDNNRFANKVDSNYYAQLLADKSFPLINRPVMQRSAPGSTFKMITAFAALEEGVVGPTETVLDLGEFDKINPAAKCHIYPGSHGSVDIVEALKVSCNYFFYEMGWRLSIDSSGRFRENLGLERLQKYASMFGLNEPSGIELNEATPEISVDDSVRSSIGQGTNDYTPIQLSRYITTLANRGTNYDLTLLNKIVDKDGKVVLENKAEVNQDLTKMKASTWDSVYEGMYSVVNETGGSVYGLYNNFDIVVAGKTGTSQISKVNPNNALFVSFAPYNAPEISVTAVIPNGYTSSNAAELSKDIYKLYFNLEESEELLEGEVSVTDTNNNSAIE